MGKRRLAMKAQNCAKIKHIWKGVVSNSETLQQIQQEKKWIGAKLYRASAQFGTDKGQWKDLIKRCQDKIRGMLTIGKVKS